jgi:hypothetical protein
MSSLNLYYYTSAYHVCVVVASAGRVHTVRKGFKYVLNNSWHICIRCVVNDPVVMNTLTYEC